VSKKRARFEPVESTDYLVISMNRSSNRHALWMALLLAACSHAMQVPSTVAGTPPVKVERYGALKERELKLGGAVVRNIERSWSRPTGRGVVNFQKAPEETSLKFAIKEQDRGLAAECVETLSTNMMGLKDPKVHLVCVCKEGETLRAKLELDQYRGTAELTGLNRFQVSALHKDTRGKSRHEVLGYWFQSPAGQGAVDLNDEGRVWLPQAVTPEEKPILLCLYAGLLLYRPGETL
jgi:hypothetical protein